MVKQIISLVVNNILHSLIYMIKFLLKIFKLLQPYKKEIINNITACLKKCIHKNIPV